MKIVKKDSKGHKSIDPASPAFQDYLDRYEDICVIYWKQYRVWFFDGVHMHTHTNMLPLHGTMLTFAYVCVWTFWYISVEHFSVLMFLGIHEHTNNIRKSLAKTRVMELAIGHSAASTSPTTKRGWSSPLRKERWFFYFASIRSIDRTICAWYIKGSIYIYVYIYIYAYIWSVANMDMFMMHHTCMYTCYWYV